MIHGDIDKLRSANGSLLSWTKLTGRKRHFGYALRLYQKRHHFDDYVFNNSFEVTVGLLSILESNVKLGADGKVIRSKLVPSGYQE